MKVRFIPLLVFSVALIGGVLWYASSKNKHRLEAQFSNHLPVLVKLYQGNQNIHFRGIDAKFDSVVWVSGSQGVFGKSLDYGRHWVFGRIPKADSLELRDIEVLDAKTAIVMSAGYPTRLFKTTDGGESWRVVFASDDKRMFLDGMDFCPCGVGMAFGDPVNGKFTILKTDNWGDTWQHDTVNAPFAKAGEAGFAASGSSIQCLQCNSWVIGTGGSASRILYTKNGLHWKTLHESKIAGQASQGIFSLAVNDSSMVYVGGDYAADTTLFNTGVAHGLANGFSAGAHLPYQSSVVFVNDTTLVSIGTAGGFISHDLTQSWHQFTTDGMHTLVASQSNNVVYASGANGRIAKIVFNKAQLAY